MARAKVKTYKEQKFDLHGLDGISDKQLEEHFALYAGYVKQVNALNEELAKLRGEGKASGKNPEFAELTRRLEEHFALYAGYVKQVNALNEELAKLRGEGK